MIIEPGYKSEGAELYPMVRLAKDTDGNYIAAQSVNTTNLEGGNANYLVSYVSKLEIDKITTEDFFRYVREKRGEYHNLKYVAFHFEDNTGMIFHLNQDNHPIYGEMNEEGFITDLLSDIDINDSVSEQLENLDDIDIHSIHNVECYLSYIKDINYTVFMSVRDEATSSLSEIDIRRLEELNLNEELKGKYRYSYLFCIDEGKIIFEKIDKKVLTEEGSLDNGDRYVVSSAGGEAGDYASIKINNIEYSMNRRGMNFVIYDKTKRLVIDTVAFDTFLGGVYR